MSHPKWEERNPSYVAIFTASVGGLLEMYDFMVYAFLAPTINQLFFSATNAKSGLIFTFATFAIGYLMRPIGGIVFGHIGDKAGRRSGLLATILLMGSATLLIGCLPTYSQIGIWAPILLLLLRMLQGFAVGGDLPGGITYLSEESDNHCGRYMGYLFAAINVGILLASCAVFCFQHTMTPAAFLAWGWRAIFWSSLVLTTLGLFFRTKLVESPVFQQLQQQEQLHRVPIAYLLTDNLRLLLRGMALMVPFICIVVGIFVYTPTYLHTFWHMPYHRALQFNIIGIICFICSLLAMGYVSDRWQPRRCLWWALSLLIIMPPFAYHWLGGPYTLLTMVGIGWICGFCGVVITHKLALLFNPAIRYTGIALAYNIMFAIGGLIPMILTIYIPYFHHLGTMPTWMFWGSSIFLLVFMLSQPRFLNNKAIVNNS